MRYQIQTTTSCGPLLTATLHVVVFTEPHDSDPCAVPTPGAHRQSDADPIAKFEKVARPTGVKGGRTRPGLRMIPIEGAESWEATVRNSA